MSTTPLKRTLASLRNAWRGLIFSGQEFRPDRLSPDLPDSDAEKLRILMQDCLTARGGEVSSRARAALLGQAYLTLNNEGRIRYLAILANELSVSPEALKEARDIIDDANSTQEKISKLRGLLTPPRVSLLTRFNDLPQGVKFLVDLRADVLAFMDKAPDLKSLDYDLKRLLNSWFDIGFLELKRLTWKDPAELLEKLIEYEAVHEISSWDDLKNRLDSDRRCYAFFHPCMPDEPLIFVEIALVKGIARSIQSLLDENAPTIDPGDADTAIFYSITNTQTGLQGIHFGSFLIKQVLDDLKRDLPQLNKFATLSPVPGLMEYLAALSLDKEAQLVDAAHRAELEKDYGSGTVREVLGAGIWKLKLEGNTVLKPIMMKLCAHYLVNEKKGSRSRDPVANFHLNNGARLENINWLGDTSEHGLLQSAGIMVNYVYSLNDIEKNHETYRASGEVVASSVVKAILS